MVSRIPEIDVSVLHDILECDALTGTLTWRRRDRKYCCSDGQWKATNSKLEGKRAGYRMRYGYIGITILDQQYAAHRIVFTMVNGHWPKGEIDHINGIRTDNRILNLRDVPAQENQKNRPLQSNNSSGVQGVRKNNRKQKWVAFIYSGGKQIHLGSFETKDGAIRARVAAERDLGFHFNHGRKSA